MATSAGQPFTQFVTIIFVDVAGWQTMVVGLQLFTKGGSIGEDIAPRSRQKYVLALFNTAVCSAVADHNFAIEWLFSLPGAAQSLVPCASRLGLRFPSAAQGVTKISCMHNFALARTTRETGSRNITRWRGITANQVLHNIAISYVMRGKANTHDPGCVGR